jgi:hypothetical protein
MKRIRQARMRPALFPGSLFAQQTPCLFIAPVRFENHRTVLD